MQKTKEKALAETKAKAGIAQAEVDEAQKHSMPQTPLIKKKVAKLKQDEALRKIFVPADYAKHDIKDYEWFIAHQNEFMKLQPEIDWDAYNKTALGTNKDKVDLETSQQLNVKKLLNSCLKC